MALNNQFTNFATATIATASVGTGATTLALTAGQGTLFPSLGGAKYFYAVITDSLTAPTKQEIVKVTSIAGDTISVMVRAQDNTTAQSWVAGNYFTLRWVNASIQDTISTALQAASNLSDLNSVGTARTNLGLTGAATLTLPINVANGGTGATSLTGVVIGNGTSAFTTVSAPAGTIVGTTDAQTLTNKVISGSANTISNISLATQVTGNLPVTNLNSGTSAGATTFWCGDGTWKVPTTVDATFLDGSFRIQNTADNTKQFAFDASGITSATTRTWIIPDANSTFVGTGTTQTLTNKTLTSPTIGTAMTLSFATVNAFIFSGTASALTSTAAATNGQLLVGSTGGNPVAATLTGTANQVIVTNGPGTITLATPQSIDTGAAVTFLTINKYTFTAPAASATLTILNNKTFTVNNTITLAGTDGQTYTFPTTTATIARTDADNSWGGTQTFTTLGFTTLNIGASGPTLVQDAAAVSAIKNGATAQALRIYGTTTGPKYLSVSHDGTNGIVNAQSGQLQLISAVNQVIVTGGMFSDTTNSRDLGAAGNVWATLYCGTAIRGGANGTTALGAAAVGFTKLYMDYTNTGTVGAVTINKAAGRVNLAAAGTSLVVTNSIVTAASHIFLNADSAPGNIVAVQLYAVPTAGSFTITAVPAVTNQTAIDFFVVNAD